MIFMCSVFAANVLLLSTRLAQQRNTCSKLRVRTLLASLCFTADFMLLVVPTAAFVIFGTQTVRTAHEHREVLDAYVLVST